MVKRLEQTFPPMRYTKPSQHRMDMCAVSLVIRGTCIKATPMKTAVPQEQKQNEKTNADEDGEKLDPRAALVGMVQPLWRMVSRALKQLKLELPSDPAVSLLGLYRNKIPLVGLHPKDLKAGS